MSSFLQQGRNPARRAWCHGGRLFPATFPRGIGSYPPGFPAAIGIKSIMRHSSRAVLFDDRGRGRKRIRPASSLRAAAIGQKRREHRSVTGLKSY